MVIVIMKMNARPEKCLEFSQTLQALMEPTRKEKGCLSHNVHQDIEYDNSFSLIQVWQRRGDSDAHLRSDRFTELMGTRSLLKPTTGNHHTRDFAFSRLGGGGGRAEVDAQERFKVLGSEVQGLLDFRFWIQMTGQSDIQKYSIVNRPLSILAWWIQG